MSLCAPDLPWHVGDLFQSMFAICRADGDVIAYAHQREIAERIVECVNPPTGDIWLVELRKDLEHLPVTPTTSPTDRFGVWRGVADVNGVRSLTDMRVISFETLQELVAPSDPLLVKRWRREKAQALRAKRHAKTTAA